MTLEEESLKLKGVQYGTEEQQRAITSSAKKREVAEKMLSCRCVWW